MGISKRSSAPFFLMFLLLVAGCTATPTVNDATEPAIFNHPVDTVHSASVTALTVTGFDVTKDEATYIEGSRPRKMGLLVGSGGETVGIWITEQNAESSLVRVQTAKSFVGSLGQKNWDAKILEEIQKTLDQQ